MAKKKRVDLILLDSVIGGFDTKTRKRLPSISIPRSKRPKHLYRRRTMSLSDYESWRKKAKKMI